MPFSKSSAAILWMKPSGILKAFSSRCEISDPMIYPIVRYGDSVLERPAAVVTEFDTPELHSFIEEIFQSRYAPKGVGLAAPQIGFSRRIAVIDCSNGENPAEKIVLINPKILKIEGKQEGEEGCLSIPGFRE